MRIKFRGIVLSETRDMMGDRRIERRSNFFDDPFADFDDFFMNPFADESMEGSGDMQPQPQQEQPQQQLQRDYRNAMVPSWRNAFGPMTSLSRLARGLGRSFDETYRRIEEMSRAPQQDSDGSTSHCFCSATSEVILPNGAHEVKHTSRDSRTGKELSLHTREVEGRRVTERRERDLRTGREERRQDLLNVEESGLGKFDKDWARLFPAREESRLPALRGSN